MENSSNNSLETYLAEVKKRCDVEEWEKIKSTSEMMTRASIVMAVDVPRLLEIIEFLWKECIFAMTTNEVDKCLEILNKIAQGEMP